jgi:multidrug resistance efflux pump
VVANIRPVAANVEGYITGIYVKNEAYVKKGQPLFTVFKKPYELHHKKTQSDVAEAEAQLIVLNKQVEKTQHLLQSQKEHYEKFHFDYAHYKSALNDHAVSEMITNTTLKDKNSAMSQLKALESELELNRQQIEVQKMKIKSLVAVMQNAKVDLDETTVYAKNNGVIQNMFVALGAPVKIRQPLFSFVDTDTLFIQANFNETDLRRVRAGDKVTIYPRMYFGSKRYHGIIFSNHWSASRLETHRSTQLQIVNNSESNWFLLPQRLPVQIQITDYDPIHYPLNIGSSAYVYIHTQ